MPETRSDYNKIAGRKTQRAEALADGVFAIAMTLLVLDLRLPISEAIKGDLLLQLVSTGPKLISYVLSFMTLGIFWTGHSAQYTYIAGSNRHLNRLSIFFLMFVSILPFTTAFLSDHINFRLAVGLYWLNILFLGLIIFLHGDYAYRHGFVSPDVSTRQAVDKAIRGRIIMAQLPYVAAALLCFINNYLSISVTIAIQLNYAIAPSFRRKT